jgi:TonB family protein
MTPMFKARYLIYYSLLFISIVCLPFAAFGNNPQVAESDNPREVLKKTLSATQTVKSYRVRIEYPPVSKTVIIVEFAPQYRARIHQRKLAGGQQEVIKIGNNYYRKDNDGPWKKYPENYIDLSVPIFSPDMVKNTLNSLAGAEDIKFIRQEIVEGIPTLAYQYIMRHGNYPQAMKVWIGVADGLVRRWEHDSAAKGSTKSPVVYTFYDYNTDIEINPPATYILVPDPGPVKSVPPGPNDIPVTDVDTKPIALSGLRPKYTKEARKNKTEGAVLARILVGADGLVKQVQVRRGLPDGLNEEAIRAAYQLRFKPATKNGQPVAYWMQLEIEFRLR